MTNRDLFQLLILALLLGYVSSAKAQSQLLMRQTLSSAGPAQTGSSPYITVSSVGQMGIIGPLAQQSSAGRQGFIQPISRSYSSLETIEISVFPNPSVSSFTLQLNPSPSSSILLRWVDLQGRVVAKRLLKLSDSEEIQWPPMRAGTYVLEVQYERGTSSHMIQKL